MNNMYKYNFIIIDHYDSFTSNLIDLLEEFSESITSFYSDVDYHEIYKKINSTEHCILILSPGYGSPYDHLQSINLIRNYQNKIPIIGICLGHQLIAVANHGMIEKGIPVHGKSTEIHSEHTIFNFVERPQVGRYHSYHISSLPERFNIIASDINDEIMAIESETKLTFGLQFHIESILTTYGSEMIERLLNYIGEHNEFTKAS